MPAIELFVSAPRSIQPFSAQGILPIHPAVPGLPRVLVRELVCTFRFPPVPGGFEAVVDTGAPLSIIPHWLWSGRCGWRAGRDYDELNVPGLSPSGHVLQYRYSFRLARLRVPIVLSGKNLKGDRLQIDSLVCQLADPGGPPFIILGLWGSVFDNRKLAIDREPNGDDLLARLEF